MISYTISHTISYNVITYDIVYDIVPDIVCYLYTISYNLALWYRSENFCKSLNTSYDQIMLISKPLISMLFSLLPKRSCVRSLLDCTESISCQPQCMRSKRFCAAQRRCAVIYYLEAKIETGLCQIEESPGISRLKYKHNWSYARVCIAFLWHVCQESWWKAHDGRPHENPYAQSAFSSAWSSSPWGKLYVKLEYR